MAEDLPILKGILKGNVNYHNARKLLSSQEGEFEKWE